LSAGDKRDDGTGDLEQRGGYFSAASQLTEWAALDRFAEAESAVEHAADADPRGGQNSSPARVLTDERG
jgi:hypothetical protein